MVAGRAVGLPACARRGSGVEWARKRRDERGRCGWLATLGLARYEQAFRDNDIDVSMLPTLSAEDLEKIGVASLTELS
jgi:hypothetical protein